MRRVKVLLVGKTPLFVTRPWGSQKPPEAHPSRPRPEEEARTFLLTDSSGAPAIDGEDLLSAIRKGLSSASDGKCRLSDVFHLGFDLSRTAAEPNGFARLVSTNGSDIQWTPEIVVVRDRNFEIQGTVALPRVEAWAVRLEYLYDETKVEPTYREFVVDALRRAGEFGVGAFCPRDRCGEYGRFVPTEWHEEVVADEAVSPQPTPLAEVAA